MEWLFLLVSIHFQCLYGFDETFKYEQLHMFGLGRPIVSLRKDQGYAYPEELSTQPQPYVKSPYRNIYQGSRMPRDTRVFNKRFQYPPRPRGHHIYCEGVFECTLSYIAIESNSSVPTLLRGGVGYKHFSVVIKAHHGEELAGRVRAYCVNILQDKKYGVRTFF